MKITKNFSLAEIEHSDTALSHGIKNIVPQDAYKVMYKLFETVMQPLREKIGPIKINSGYRCLELNRLVGSSPTSQHVYQDEKGAACDIVGNVSTTEILNAVLNMNLNFDQMILEHPSAKNGGWLHISIGNVNSDKYRRQLLLKEPNKKYIPLPSKYIIIDEGH